MWQRKDIHPSKKLNKTSLQLSIIKCQRNKCTLYTYLNPTLTYYSCKIHTVIIFRNQPQTSMVLLYGISSNVSFFISNILTGWSSFYAVGYLFWAWSILFSAMSFLPAISSFSQSFFSSGKKNKICFPNHLMTLIVQRDKWKIVYHLSSLFSHFEAYFEEKIDEGKSHTWLWI